jgi:hypothetical protein
MKVLTRLFNIYLALAILLGLAGGCQTEKKKSQTAALRVHIEVPPDPTGDTQPISVIRSDPVLITVKRMPILTEANLLEAKIIEAQGGFALSLKFDETGTWTVEQYSASNPGLHFVIYGQWSEKPTDGRWLAAPLITHRVTGGTLVFTPDCSREEADQFVLGLKEAMKQIHKGQLK